MVKVVRRGGVDGLPSNYIEAQADAQSELTTDAECIACCPGSIIIACDVSWKANKKNDMTWNVVT